MSIVIDDPTPYDDEAGLPDDPKLGPANTFDAEHPKNEVYASPRPQADDQP